MSQYDMHDWDTDGWPGEYLYGDDAYMDDYYMEERWKPIRGFESEYWVSNLARVWSCKNNQFLKVKHMDSHGHLGVCLYSGGKRYYRYIHRLVAEAFLPNPNNLPVVRHIYDDPSFNTAYDLKWGTQYDNIHDAIKNDKAYIFSPDDRERSYEKSRTPIKAINLYTGEVLTFRGQGEASRILGIPQANICKVLKGKRYCAHNYTFEYLERCAYDGYY